MENKTKEIKRFDAKIESKLLTQISKLLKQQNEVTEEKAIESETPIGVMDATNVSMVIAKTEESKRVLSRFLTEREDKIPELDYKTARTNNTAKYPISYVIKIMAILNVTNDSVNISLLNDFPSTFENDHFKIILAPRIEN